jgi:pimeloyl-ACP methyl ester carboxylesterase
MSGLNPPLPTSEGEPRPVLGIGGLLTGPECAAFYKPLLDDGLDEWELSPTERFIPIPERGRGQFDETLKRLEEQVLIKRQKLGRAVVLVGHSMGSFYAEEVELNHPEIADDVVLAAGVHEGQKYETFDSFFLRHSLGNPRHADYLKHDSEEMKAHIKRVATEWPAGVGLHAVSTAYDTLLPFMHGLQLKLPEGQQAERHVIALPLPGMQSILQFLSHNRQVMHMPSLRPSLHVDIVRHPAFIKYVRNLQTRVQVASIEQDGFSLPAELAA